MEGRNQSFADGNTKAQNGLGSGQITPIKVEPQSVLQPTSSSGSGHAEPDRQRKLQGQNISNNGQSQQTALLNTQKKYPFIQV